MIITTIKSTVVGFTGNTIIVFKHNTKQMWKWWLSVHTLLKQL